MLDILSEIHSFCEKNSLRYFMAFGTLLGAFLAEFLISRKDGWQSIKSALGALLGFLFGTGIKLIASGLMMYYIIVFLK